MTKKRHKKCWFINRVSKEVVRNEAVDLFNPPIIIASVPHAAALYISQTEKNYTYSETTNNEINHTS